MSEYHKINGPFKRDMSQKSAPLIFGEWARPEFDYLKDCEWVGYEKIDGTNIRIYFDGENVEFRGRTDRAQMLKHLLTFLQRKYTKELLAKAFPDLEYGEVVLYGEGYGHKIQKGGRYNLGDGVVGFILFDVLIGPWPLRKPDVKAIAEAIDTPVVKEMARGTLLELMDIVAAGLRCSHNSERFAEGIVCIPSVDLFARDGQRVITKIKHKDFYGARQEEAAA